MLFGSVLKKVREDKNISQKKLSENIMSRTHLSEMENNKHYPSYEKFIHLLNKLNITYDEFLYELHDQKLPNEKDYFLKLSYAAAECNIEKLFILSNESFNLFNTTSNIKYKYISLISKALAHLYSNNGKVDTNIIIILQPIRTYLLSINNWHLYEIKLLNNCLFSFSFEEALYFGKQAVKSINYYNGFTEMQNTQQHLLLNLSTLCIENNQYKQGLILGKQALNLSNNHLLVFEKILSEINIAICNIKLNKRNEKKTLQKYVSMLYELEMDNTANDILAILNEQKITLSLSS